MVRREIPPVRIRRYTGIHHAHPLIPSEAAPEFSLSLPAPARAPPTGTARRLPDLTTNTNSAWARTTSSFLPRAAFPLPTRPLGPAPFSGAPRKPVSLSFGMPFEGRRTHA